MADNKMKAQKTYSVRPSFQDKFNVTRSREIIKDIVDTYLADKTIESSSEKAAIISEFVRDALKDEYHDRYKIMVQVVVGAKQGTKIVSRCFWDTDTDTVASYTQFSDDYYCVVSAYAVYIY